MIVASKSKRVVHIKSQGKSLFTNFVCDISWQIKPQNKTQHVSEHNNPIAKRRIIKESTSFCTGISQRYIPSCCRVTWAPFSYNTLWNRWDICTNTSHRCYSPLFDNGLIFISLPKPGMPPKNVSHQLISHRLSLQKCSYWPAAQQWIEGADFAMLVFTWWWQHLCEAQTPAWDLTVNSLAQMEHLEMVYPPPHTHTQAWMVLLFACYFGTHADHKPELLGSKDASPAIH